MGKYIGRSTIIEHKGLAKLKVFCANNIPYLICRDETITDVGIDGEIEISSRNEDGKVEATGERIKFQLKSTESDNSYIQQETETDFSFYANSNDVDYWSKHKQDVLLIIYDVRCDKLYGKKISKHDYLSQKQNRIKFPINFHKPHCILEPDNFDFHKQFSTSIKTRLDYNFQEPAMTNLFRVRKFPKLLYQYETDFTRKNEVYKSLPQDHTIPEFVLYNRTIFTFTEPKNQPQYFKDHVIKYGTEKFYLFKNVSHEKQLRNHYVELIKIYFKKFLSTKGIYLNKDHNRFYFGIRNGEAVRSILAKTRKQGRKSPKEVAKFYIYGKYEFYRHTAFEIEFIHSDSMYITITPTYLITSDGKTPSDSKLASKFIITQKSREFNPNVANNVHTIFSYLSNEQGDGITIYNNDGVELEFSSYIPQMLPFHISTDDKGFSEYLKRQKKANEKLSNKTLFEDGQF